MSTHLLVLHLSGNFRGTETHAALGLKGMKIDTIGTGISPPRQKQVVPAAKKGGNCSISRLLGNDPNNLGLLSPISELSRSGLKIIGS